MLLSYLFPHRFNFFLNKCHKKCNCEVTAFATLSVTVLKVPFSIKKYSVNATTAQDWYRPDKTLDLYLEVYSGYLIQTVVTVHE